MSVLPVLPRGFVVGRILASRGDSADADKFPDTAVVVGLVGFTPATPYRKLDAATVVTHSKITAKLDSHGDLHPQREASDNTGSEAEDGIWLPTGTWKVTYQLNPGFGALPEHHIEVATAHTEAAPLPLFANLGDPAPAGATFVQLSVPLGGQQGQVLVMNDGSLSWGTPSGGGGSSTIAADDTPAAPAEGESASYFVTSAVTWPAGLVWSTDPDGGVAPTITGTALVSMFTVDGVTRAILGATFPAVATPADTTAPTWSATFTLGTPTQTRVVATASTLATDNVGVTGYEVSYNGGSSWVAISPSGSNFTLTGSAGTTYATTRLRARDAAGNTSPILSVPSYTMAASTDATPPAVGTMAASAITTSGFTLTVSGASDAGGLHAQPYAFTIDGGATWSTYQASAVYVASGLTPSTTYTCTHKVRDAAGNETTGTSITVYTTAASGRTWIDTFSDGTGTAEPAGWTKRYTAPTTGTYTEEAGYLDIQRSASGRSAITLDAANGTGDVDALIKARYLNVPVDASSTFLQGILVGGSGGVASEDCIIVYARGGTTPIRALRYDAGTYTELGTGGSGGPIGIDSWWWIRVNYAAGQLKARFWMDGAAEPSTWHINAAAGVKVGWVGIWDNCPSGRSLEVDYFSASTAGSAPTP